MGFCGSVENHNAKNMRWKISWDLTGMIACGVELGDQIGHKSGVNIEAGPPAIAAADVSNGQRASLCWRMLSWYR